MYALKGFAVHALMASNIPGVVAQLGELSPQSATYSREKGYYTGSVAPNVTLISMLSKQDGVMVEATTEIANHALAICKWVYDRTLTSNAPVFADQLLQLALTTFASSADAFECGEIVYDGNYYMPEWISWKSKLTGLGDNRFKIWFVDAAFAGQYDEYELVIVPPMDNLNDFFKTGTQVEALLKARSLAETMDKIQAAKAGAPETIIRVETYDYVDPLNATHKVASNWGVLIYGAAGNNVDAIKDELVEYILENSTHTREEWSPILPDIFRRTEFVIVPRWDTYAIPNRTLEAGIYSPIVNLTEAIAKLKAVIPDYPETHINTNAAAMAHPYKSLQLLVVGGPENRDSKFKITDMFPDFIAVSSTSIDFNRMSEPTRAWALSLAELLLVAETVGEFTSTPVSITKTTRDGILYVVRSYQNVHYLVAAKSSIDA